MENTAPLETETLIEVTEVDQNLFDALTRLYDGAMRELVER